MNDGLPSAVGRAPNGDFAIGDVEWGPRTRTILSVDVCKPTDYGCFWAVYIRGLDPEWPECAEWVADFQNRAHCELFVGALSIQRGGSK